MDVESESKLMDIENYPALTKLSEGCPSLLVLRR